MVEQQADTAVATPECPPAEVLCVDNASVDTPEKLVEKGQEVGLGALKCAIEAIGDAIADLADVSSPIKKEADHNSDETSLEHKHTSKQGTHTNVDAFISDECSVTQNDQNEITKAKEEGGASQDPTQVAGVTNVESQKPPEAQSVEEKDKQERAADEQSKTVVHIVESERSEAVVMENTHEEANSNVAPKDVTGATDAGAAPIGVTTSNDHSQATLVSEHQSSETVKKTTTEGGGGLETITTTTITTTSKLVTTKVPFEESPQNENGDSEAESINTKDTPQIFLVPVDLEGSFAQSAENEELDDEEIEIEEEIEVDDTASMESGSQAGTGELKKKKKLRIFKKIKRGTKAVVIDAPKAVAYGALFSAGALVGGSIVGGKAVGHGAVTGTKAIGEGAVHGAQAIGHGAQAIGHGTKELARNAVQAVADGSRAGAEFVTEAGDKIVVGTKELAHNVADGTVKVVTTTKNAVVDGVEATAYGALYGAGAVIGGTKAVGHGVVDGTTKIAAEARDTAASFAKASAGVVGDIAHGARTGVCAVANAADRAKTAVEDKAREALLNAAQAALDGAQFAGYKVEGGNSALAIESGGADTKNISSNSSKISKGSKSSKFYTF